MTSLLFSVGSAEKPSFCMSWVVRLLGLRP